MRKLFGSFFAMNFNAFILFFVLPGLTQEDKRDGRHIYYQKRESLLDISSKFLKDPFSFGQNLWERNPYITNPH